MRSGAPPPPPGPRRPAPPPPPFPRCAVGHAAPRAAKVAAAELGPAQHVVAAEALATFHPPAEEGAVQPQAPEIERRPARDLAGGAARPAVLVDPQLEPGAQLAPLGVVRRGQARIDDVHRPRLAVLAALDDRGGHRLDGVVVLAGRSDGGQRDGQVVVQPGRDRTRELDAIPVGRAPGAPALPETVDRDALAGDRGAAAHAHRLLVARHAAGPRHVVAGVELGDGAGRLELEVEGGALAGEAQPPRPQRLDRRHLQASGGALVPRRRWRGQLDAALGAHGHWLAAAEEDGQAAGGAVGEPQPGHAVQLGGAVGEGHGDRVAEAVALCRARRVLVDPDAHGSARGSTSVAVLSTSAPGPDGGRRRALPGAATISRPAKRRTSSLRMAARVGGSRKAAPKMSVTNPGVSSSAPPKITSAPSTTSRAGMRPTAIASLKRRHAARPCERMSIEPAMESATSSAIVHRAPIACPTWMIT